MLIQDHWNKVVKKDFKSLVKIRDYISFSDIGKAYIDRYYKMKGEPETNPFEERTLRIFDAGRVMEFIILRALTMAGLLHKKQEWVKIPATNNVLAQLGYLDATIGGFVNYDVAKEIIKKHLEEYKLKLDEQLLEQKAVNIIDGLKKEFPNGQIKETVVEAKSINSMAFWSHKNRDAQGNFLGYPHNKLQCYGYMKGKKIENGILLYISKDDFVIQEIGLILGNEEMERQYKEDVEKMSFYYLNNLIPPKEEEIVFNVNKKTFELNWQVKRSRYLTKIYGYQNEDDFEDKKKPKVNEINLALKHLREIEKETDEKKKATLSKKLSAEAEIIKLYQLEGLK